MGGDFFDKKSVSRREFLKHSGQAAFVMSSGLSLNFLLSSCATTLAFKEEGPVIYPSLKGHKVQPPENGCYIGIYREGWPVRYAKKPKILGVPLFISKGSFFNLKITKEMSAEGHIPLVFRDLSWNIKRYGFKNLPDNEKFNYGLEKYAQDIVKLGKPIFFCTMRNINGSWYPWNKSPKTSTKVWKHMWQVFEDNGANKYATWLWEINPSSYGSDKVGNPETYYPGDKYVDWIGISAYSRAMFTSAWSTLGELAGQTYSQMRRNHPDKPIMMAEFGKTKGRNQENWIREAYKTIKSWPGMKAAIYWDNTDVECPEDSTLTEKSLQAQKQIFKDPYFIGAE